MPSSPASAEATIRKASVNWLGWVLVLLFALAGIVLRFQGLKFVSGDMRFFLFGWYDRLVTGGFAEMRDPFSNYTPPYLYLLYLATKTSGFLSKITAIKLLSIGFDFLNAFMVYKILRRRFPQGVRPWIGAGAFLLLPTVLLNSAYWGQCDSIYAFFLLACIFFLMKEQSLPAMIFLGISFSFKAQAVFLAPLILLLILKKRIPWFYPGIIPLIYVLLMIPAALTGRPFVKLLTIYVAQEGTYSALSLHAPNWYLLFPKSLDTPNVVFLGLLITLMVALAWIRNYAGKIKEITPASILLYALMSVAFMPFFLPKMHERYFYLADILSLLVAFYFSHGWILALGYQLTSGLSYAVYLLTSIEKVSHVFAGNLLITALFINIALMGFLFSYPWKLGDERVYESYN